MIDLKKLEKILPLVEKPGRYIGGEVGIARKNTDVPIRFLFAFPDIYEVGMSHLGSVILYHLTNEREDTYAERAYAPFPDMQEQMQKEGIPLFSLETHSAAREFDIIGFNLSYEMCYTTVLRMLELANIPLRARERGEEFPLIIAGGTCTYNPEPLADFIDLFIIGEGEQVNMELLDLYAAHKKAGGSREEFLKAAAGIEGIYVPSLTKVCYHEDGTVQSIRGEHLPVRKRFLADMDSAYFPDKLIVPNIGIVHDRVTLEIFRGCTRGCRFCQAGFIYRPVREKKVPTLCAQAEKLIKSTGYEEISLSSLSSGDYSELDTLANQLFDAFEEKRVSISLPSLRVDSFQKDYAKRMQGAHKQSFTFAPEAGTQRLRDVINKNITEEEILRGVRYAFESGATTIKLYFMIGLPTETYEDLDGIADLVLKIKGVFGQVPRELRRGSLQVNVSTASFVPKPFTPFQWEAQDTRESLHQKQQYLKEKLRMRGVKYSYHDTALSYLEAVFARGDRRLCDVLFFARQNGAQFDSWQDQFNQEAFDKAFLQAGVDPDFYACRERSLEEVLPWSHIDAYIAPGYLKRELIKAKEAAVTPDCREGCQGCGLGRFCLK